ncbi:GNAT family N-acetyltransferase [Marinicrinis lubricantis]|uniref:GNAT family N-acetyltransferase n=1 Tax=Marinicrinis lubricantis TaxID=2086470 RepID=A0ABW1IJ56_9BACL
MLDRTVRRMELSEFDHFYACIENDFPVGEYAPHQVMKGQVSRGLQEGWVYQEGEQALGYAFCAAGHPNDCVLLSFFAIHKPYRKHGIGSEFLAALNRKYDHKRTMLVEVEKPELSETENERIVRNNRIAFYGKAGYRQIPAIEYVIWDVPMHLMAAPLAAEWPWIVQHVGQIIYDINEMLMGQRYMHHMKFVRLKGQDATRSQQNRTESNND